MGFREFFKNFAPFLVIGGIITIILFALVTKEEPKEEYSISSKLDLPTPSKKFLVICLFPNGASFNVEVNSGEISYRDGLWMFVEAGTGYKLANNLPCSVTDIEYTGR